MTTGVRLQVLGPLHALVDGNPVDLGGPRPRALLAMLLCAYPAVVSLDRLIDGVWGGRPPASAVSTARAYLSRLRRALERDRSGSILAAAAPGYALCLPDGAVDAWRFEKLLGDAMRIGASDPSAGRTRAQEALDLWRGPAYAEFTGMPWAASESARLEELRLTCWELHIELTIRSGVPREAVASARALTGLHPMREQGWRLLTIGLWATGRQVEALAVLRESCRVLINEVGVAPGPAHVTLERAILAQRIEVLREWTGSGRSGEPPDGVGTQQRLVRLAACGQRQRG
jgi:DNA-binding SARP family transcriptional activator